MRSVWSYWTKPFAESRSSTWRNEWHHWLAWGLSLEAARQHYPDTFLYTDDEGARVLVDELQLPFEHVSTMLNKIGDEDPQWWALGKLAAYAQQDAPFVHVDSDVFLWKPLAAELENAAVFAQNPEPIQRGSWGYHPEELERALGETGRLPDEWIWYRTQTNQRAECCGIFGGQNVEFIQRYAEEALRLVASEPNRGLLKPLGKSGHMILIEQYLLTACVEYHGTGIRYVFPDIMDAYIQERAEEAGYTHLASNAKKNANYCRYLEQRVKLEMPEHFERCSAYIRERSGSYSFWDSNGIP